MGKIRKSRPKSSKPVIDDLNDNSKMNLRLSDSDEDAEDNILLEQVLKPNRQKLAERDAESSIYGIGEDSLDDEEVEEGEEEEDSYESSEEDEDLKEELADSDIDGMDEDDLPNIKAWGKNKKNYYNTDYVDDDHGGFLEEEDEIAADIEEKEAMAIQKRLLSEIEGTEDMFKFLIKTPDEKISSEDRQSAQIISKDLTEMSKKEKLQLLEKESPEFLGLVNDFNELMKDARLHLLPVIRLLEKGKIPPCTAGDSVKLRLDLILNYCTNISFYVLLKLKRQSVNHHPVIHRLVAAKQLILKLEPIYQDQLLPQIELILQTDNLEALIDPIALADMNTKLDKLLVQKEERLTSQTKKHKTEVQQSQKDAELCADESSQKRAITYQIAKNRGLTPHRKKELKNPRVKNKLKYRKAKIRRKGQVREARKELERYGGEMSGIKAGVRKSIAIK